MAKTFDYTGVEVLEAMEYAKNYNNYLLRLVLKTIRKRQTRNSDVLDFGAGTGMYAKMLNQQFAIKPVCLEPDRKLKSNIAKEGFEVIDKLDKKAGRFGTVYSLNVFEHIKDDYRVAEQLFENMSEGATLLIYVPANQMLYSSMDRLVEHHRRYDKKGLETLLKDAGFTIQSLHYADPLGFFAALLYKLFDNGKGKVAPLGIKLFDTVAFPLSLALQPITKHLFGKNLVAIVIKEKTNA